GVLARVEVAAHAGTQALDRIVRWRLHQLPSDRVHELGLELLVHRPEEVALVGEVVVQRAARDACAADDLLGSDIRVRPFREKLARGFDEPRARGCGAVRLAAGRAGGQTAERTGPAIHSAAIRHASERGSGWMRWPPGTGSTSVTSSPAARAAAAYSRLR